MRHRAVIASAVTAVVSAGVLVATPAAAATYPTTTKHVTCRSNANHYTASDVTYELVVAARVNRVTWNTSAPFRADRITWSGLRVDNNEWQVINVIGGVSSTPDDVAPTGEDAQMGGTFWARRLKMTVFDANWGNCTVEWNP